MSTEPFKHLRHPSTAAGKTAMEMLVGIDAADPAPSPLGNQDDHGVILDPVGVQNRDLGCLIELQDIFRRGECRVDDPAPGSSAGRGWDPEIK